MLKSGKKGTVSLIKKPDLDVKSGLGNILLRSNIFMFELRSDKELVAS